MIENFQFKAYFEINREQYAVLRSTFRDWLLTPEKFWFFLTVELENLTMLMLKYLIWIWEEWNKNLEENVLLVSLENATATHLWRFGRKRLISKRFWQTPRQLRLFQS